MATDKIKLSKKQKEVILAMRRGCPLLTGLSETNNRQYYMVGSTHNNGYGNTYFNATVFSNLLEKKLIYQEYSSPFNWVLTELGESIEL